MLGLSSTSAPVGKKNAHKGCLATEVTMWADPPSKESYSASRMTHTLINNLESEKARRSWPNASRQKNRTNLEYKIAKDIRNKRKETRPMRKMYDGWTAAFGDDVAH
jgi:hypothetical protein